MPTNPHAEAAKAEVLGRLAVFRDARADLHADIRRAAELGISTTTIARSSGLSWHGVKRILAGRRPSSPDQPERPA